MKDWSALPEDLSKQLDNDNGANCHCEAYGECECGCMEADWRTDDEVILDWIRVDPDNRAYILKQYFKICDD